MSESVYDLGEISEATAATAAPGSRPKVRLAKAPGVASRGATATYGFDVAGSLSLFLPGAGHALRGRFAVGVFFLTWMALFCALGWAVATSVDRLAENLPYLGISRAYALWALVAIYWLTALTHVAGVVTGAADEDDEPAPPHPVVAGIASAVVPGWGQVLNGARARAALLIGAIWLIAACWLVASPLMSWWMGRLDLVLPEFVHTVTSPLALWTVPAVVWTLGIYDAVASASRR